MKPAVAGYSQQAALEYARSLRPVVDEIIASGITAQHRIAGELNRRGISTATGIGDWHQTTVHRLLKRLNQPEQECDHSSKT